MGRSTINDLDVPEDKPTVADDIAKNRYHHLSIKKKNDYKKAQKRNDEFSKIIDKMNKSLYSSKFEKNAAKNWYQLGEQWTEVARIKTKIVNYQDNDLQKSIRDLLEKEDMNSMIIPLYKWKFSTWASWVGFGLHKKPVKYTCDLDLKDNPNPKGYNVYSKIDNPAGIVIFATQNNDL